MLLLYSKKFRFFTSGFHFISICTLPQMDPFHFQPKPLRTIPSSRNIADECEDDFMHDGVRIRRKTAERSSLSARNTTMTWQLGAVHMVTIWRDGEVHVDKSNTTQDTEQGHDDSGHDESKHDDGGNNYGEHKSE
jgi:hypothetical protein